MLRKSALQLCNVDPGKLQVLAADRDCIELALFENYFGLYFYCASRVVDCTIATDRVGVLMISRTIDQAARLWTVRRVDAGKHEFRYSGQLSRSNGRGRTASLRV